MQPIGCGYYPPGDSVRKFSAFKGLEERHRCKILVPLGLPRQNPLRKGVTKICCLSPRGVFDLEEREENLMYSF